MQDLTTTPQSFTSPGKRFPHWPATRKKQIPVNILQSVKCLSCRAHRVSRRRKTGVLPVLRPKANPKQGSEYPCDANSKCLNIHTKTSLGKRFPHWPATRKKAHSLKHLTISEMFKLSSAQGEPTPQDRRSS